MSVYAFGSPENQRYMAHVGTSIAPRDAAKDGSLRPAWCCPFGKGHRTPRAAAQHAARLMELEWSR